MQQSQSPLEELKQYITIGDVQNALLLCPQLLREEAESAALAITYAILLISGDEAQAALSQLQKIKQPIDTNLQATFNYTKLYANYKLGNYETILNELNVKSPTTDNKFLLAQTHSKLNQWVPFVDIYFELLANQQIEGHQDILTNLINGAIISENEQLLHKVNKFSLDFIKKLKNNVSRELLLNQSLLHLALKENNLARELGNRIINLIKLDNKMGQELDNDEDYLMAELFLDFMDIQDGLLKEESKMQLKIKQYEYYLTKPIFPQHLLIVLQNNLACLQELLLSNHHDTLKRVEDSLYYPTNKYTPQQLSQLRLNRVLVQFGRNRITEGFKQFKEFESGNPYINSLIKLVHNLKTVVPFDLTQPLIETIQLAQTPDLKVFTFLIVANHFHDQPKRILQVFQTTLFVIFPNWSKYRVLNFYMMAIMMKAEQIENSILNQIEQSGFLAEVCFFYLQTSNLDKAITLYEKLQNHPSVEDIRGRIALKYIELNQWSKAEKFLNNIPLPFTLITDYKELETLELNIQLSKTQRSKSQDMTEIIQKQIKKRRKRSRKPKNLPLNAPLPNPERWIPKYERKDYRKKKGAQLKNRTQGSSQAVGKETINVFQQHGASTANVDVSQKLKKNKKRK